MDIKHVVDTYMYNKMQNIIYVIKWRIIIASHNIKKIINDNFEQISVCMIIIIRYYIDNIYNFNKLFHISKNNGNILSGQSYYPSCIYSVTVRTIFQIDTSELKKKLKDEYLYVYWHFDSDLNLSCRLLQCYGKKIVSI